MWGEDHKNQANDGEIDANAVGALAGSDHQGAQRIDQVRQRIKVGDHL
jgi:hypothetical protein